MAKSSVTHASEKEFQLSPKEKYEYDRMLKIIDNDINFLKDFIIYNATALSLVIALKSGLEKENIESVLNNFKLFGMIGNFLLGLMVALIGFFLSYLVKYGLCAAGKRLEIHEKYRGWTNYCAAGSGGILVIGFGQVLLTLMGIIKG